MWPRAALANQIFCFKTAVIASLLFVGLFLARGYLCFGCIIASQSKQEGGRRDGLLVGSH